MVLRRIGDLTVQASPKVGLAGPLSEDWRLRLCLAFGFSFAGFAFGSPRFGFVWALWQMLLLWVIASRCYRVVVIEDEVTFLILF